MNNSICSVKKSLHHLQLEEILFINATKFYKWHESLDYELRDFFKTSILVYNFPFFAYLKYIFRLLNKMEFFTFISNLLKGRDFPFFFFLLTYRLLFICSWLQVHSEVQTEHRSTWRIIRSVSKFVKRAKIPFYTPPFLEETKKAICTC